MNRAAPRPGNDRLAIAPVEVGSLSGAVVRLGAAHIGPVDDIGPVDAARRGVDGDAIGESAPGDDDVAVGAVRISETTRLSLRSRRNRRPTVAVSLDARCGARFCELTKCFHSK